MDRSNDPWAKQFAEMTPDELEEALQELEAFPSSYASTDLVVGLLSLVRVLQARLA